MSVVAVPVCIRVYTYMSAALFGRVFGSFLHFVTAIDLSPEGINTEHIQSYPFLKIWTLPFLQIHQKHNINRLNIVG
jgi:hypothetical protein